MKYAWYSINDARGFHLEVESLEEAVKSALGCLGNVKDLVGAAEFGSTPFWDRKPLTIQEIMDIVEKHGYCQFKGSNKDAWSRVETMDSYNKGQEMLLGVMKKSAQKEADITGKETTARSLGGMSVTVKPKNKRGAYYDLHSPKDKFYGCDEDEEPRSLKDVRTLAMSMGLDMIKCYIPDGLNSYEEQHPDKAVIFDVRSEDVVMIEKE